jgi:hypothetical protein
MTEEAIDIEAEGIPLYVPNWMSPEDCLETSKLTSLIGEFFNRDEIGPVHGAAMCYAMANVIRTVLRESIKHSEGAGAMAHVMMTSRGIAALMDTVSEEIAKEIPNDVIKLFGEAQGNA